MRIANLCFVAVVAAALEARAEEAGPLTEEECRASALEAQRMVAEGDMENWDSWFRMDLVLEEAVRPCPGEDKFKKSFRTGATRTNSVGDVLSGQCQKGDQWALVRIRQVDGAWHAIFRLWGESGLNYHDFTLARRDGKTSAVDLYAYTQGETFTRMFRREYMKALAATSKDRSKLSDWEREYLDSLPRTQEIVAHIKAEEYREALKKIAALPESVRKERIMMSQRVVAAIRVGVEEGAEAIKAWKAEFPDDPALRILMIDLHLTEKKFDEAIETVRALDGVVGGDAYLTYYEGLVLVMKGDPDAARKAYELAVQKDKRLADPYWTLIEMALESKNWKEVTRLLLAVENDAGVEMSDLQDADGYKEYIATDDYQSWLKQREKPEPEK